MPSYELIYFDSRGRAELCRLLFAVAGQEYKDRRMTKEQWQEFKPQTLLGQLPLLKVDDKTYGQSIAIATFLAREFDFYGKSNEEKLQIDQISFMMTDFLGEALKVFHAEESKKEEARKEFKKIWPKFLGAFTKLLEESGTGYFVGSSVSLADLVFYDFGFNLSKRMPDSDFLDGFPLLKEHEEKIGNLEKIKSYIAQRKETAF